jgi:hypothetical protein
MASPQKRRLQMCQRLQTLIAKHLRKFRRAFQHAQQHGKQTTLTAQTMSHTRCQLSSLIKRGSLPARRGALLLLPRLRVLQLTCLVQLRQVAASQLRPCLCSTKSVWVILTQMDLLLMFLLALSRRHLLGRHQLGPHLLGQHLLWGHLLGRHLLGRHLLWGHLLGQHLLGWHLMPQ